MDELPFADRLTYLATPEIKPESVEPLNAITVYRYEDSPIPGEPPRQIPIRVEGLARYHTLQDLANAVFVASKLDEFFPKYSFFATMDATGSFQPVLWSWFTNGSTPVPLPNPIDLMASKTPLSEFVIGERRNEATEQRPRGRVLLEVAYPIVDNSLPEFYIVSYEYLRRKFGPVPPSEAQWRGLFYPYFPSLPLNIAPSLTPADRTLADQMKRSITGRIQQAGFIAKHLREVKTYPLRTNAVYLLNFVWKDITQDAFGGVEELFYMLPTNAERPYMRLITPNATPLTKLYRPDITKPPAVHDITLLKTWVSDRPPITNNNVLIIKPKLREEMYSVPALYGTFFIGDDGSARLNIQPPKGLRMLEFDKDLRFVAPVTQKLLEGMPLAVDDIKLHNATLHVEVAFPSKKPDRMETFIQDRLRKLSSIFQIVNQPASETSKPIVTIRYKAVSNFVTEDRIKYYLHSKYSQLVQRGVDDVTLAQDLRTGLMAEFDFTEDEANRRVIDFLTQYRQVSTTDAEGLDFMQVANMGTDISIFSTSYSTLSLHIYNVQSMNDFSRICTMLSLLFFSKSWGEGPENAVPAAAVAKADAAVEAAVLRDEGVAGGEEAGKEGDGNDEEEFNLFGAPEPAAPAAAAAAAVAPRAPAVVAATEPIYDPKGKKSSMKSWILDRLKKYDPTLFDFKKEDGAKGSYATKCAANWFRQPYVFSEEEYQRIRALYAPDELPTTRTKPDGSKEKESPKVAFIVYGVQNTDETIEKAKRSGAKETINVLYYGTSKATARYYFCNEYFCLRDVLPILKVDFEGDETRDDPPKSKPKNTCPFCINGEITDLARPGPGQAVYHRHDKPGTTQKHLHIGFLANPEHPKGYELPCCFIPMKHVLWTDPKLKGVREFTRGLPPSASAATAAAVAASGAAGGEEVSAVAMAEMARVQQEQRVKDAEQDAYQTRAQEPVNYSILRYSAGTEYIVNAEKFPLDAGKIGLTNVALDSFFGQDSASLVQRVKVVQELHPEARGIFRLGVFNKPAFQNDSLFAALAPLLGVNTINEVRDLFGKIINPRVFLNLNFGNLVNEFFRPEDEVPPDYESNARLYLKMTGPRDRPELSRLFRAYERFKAYLDDPTQKKQLRHFAHALAEPGLFTRQGLNIMVFEYVGDPRNESTQIEVSCPLMGVDTTRYANNNVAFLTHTAQGVYEPLMYINKVKPKDVATVFKEGHYVFTQTMLRSAETPPAYAERYDEWLTQCSSAYRGAFTYSSSVDNRVLIPVSKMIDILKNNKKGDEPILQVSGLVRDVYNHLVALTVINPYDAATEVMVPVVDDGSSFHYNTDLKIYVRIESVPKADIRGTLTVYKYLSAWLEAESDVYKITKIIRTTNVVAYMLGGAEASATIVLPCKPSELEGPPPDGIEVEQREEDDITFEYEINEQIMFGLSKDAKDRSSAALQQTPEMLAKAELARRTEWMPKDAVVLKRNEIEEIYEHLRLRFANWVAESGSAEMKEKFEEVLSNRRIPYFEKLRRFQLEFTSTIKDWLLPDAVPLEVDLSLLKRDCSKQPQEKCTGTCKLDTVDGRCKIHTPQFIKVGPQDKVPILDYLSLRLYDEIIRIPVRRAELLDNKVRRFRTPMTNIQEGKSWILPENVPAWYELLRETDTGDGREMAQYYEEFSRNSTAENIQQVKRKTQGQPIPDELVGQLNPEYLEKLDVHLVGDESMDVKSTLFKYFDVQNPATGSAFTKDELLQISRRTEKPVIQVLTKPTFKAEGVQYADDRSAATAIVLLPDYATGPALLRVVDQSKDDVPAAYLGALIGVVEKQKAVRRVVRRVPAAAVPPTENAAAAAAAPPPPLEPLVPAAPPAPTKRVSVVRRAAAAPAAAPAVAAEPVSTSGFAFGMAPGANGLD